MSVQKFKTADEFEAYLNDPQPAQQGEREHRRRVFYWRLAGRLPGAIWWCGLAFVLLISSTKLGKDSMSELVSWIAKTVTS